MGIIATPVAATKNEDFTPTQLDSYKNNLDLNGYNINVITALEVPFELKENIMYSFSSTSTINDTSTIIDSELNSYSVIVLNKGAVINNELFDLRIINTTAYIYTY